MLKLRKGANTAPFPLFSKKMQKNSYFSQLFSQNLFIFFVQCDIIHICDEKVNPILNKTVRCTLKAR